MIIKQRLSFFSLFLYLIFGTSTHMFGAVGRFLGLFNGRQRSSLSEEVGELNYWLQSPMREERLERLTQNFLAEKSRRAEEEQKQSAAMLVENRQKADLKHEEDFLAKKMKYDAEKPQREKAERDRKELHTLLASAFERRDVVSAEKVLAQLERIGEKISINNSQLRLRHYGLSGYDDQSDSESESNPLEDLSCRYTLLHSAARKGDIKFAEFLLALGADVNVKMEYCIQDGYDVQHRLGRSPLDIALRNKDAHMIELFKSSIQKKVGQEGKLPEDSEEASV